MTDRQPGAITAVIGSLRIFLIMFSAAVIIFSSLDPAGTNAQFFLTLFTAAAFIFTAFSAVKIKSHIIFGVTLIIAAVYCALIAQTTAQLVIFLIMAVAADFTACFFRWRINSLPPESASFVIELIIFILLLTLSDAICTEGQSLWVFICAVMFITLSVAYRFSIHISSTLGSISGKTTQPIGVIRRKTVGSALAVIMIIFIAALALPRNGVSVIFVVIQWAAGGFAYAVIYLFSKLSALFFSGSGDVSFMQQAPEYAAAQSSSTLEIIISAIVFSGFACIAVTLAAKIIKWLAALIKRMLVLLNHGSYDNTGRVYASKFDTIEKLNPSETAHASFGRRKLTSVDKVRRIYKSRVEELRTAGVKITGAETPDEILELARKKGCDITELTELYKRARYFDKCSSDDVKRAKSSKTKNI